MPTRRTQKVARVIRDSVSETFQHLNDPRVTGLISVTEVNVAPDMKNATVHLSIMAANEEAGKETFQAICHAIGLFQRRLGSVIIGRNCPRLRFELDTKMQKTLRTLQLIEQAAQEYKDHETHDEFGGDSQSSDESDDTNG